MTDTTGINDQWADIYVVSTSIEVKILEIIEEAVDDGNKLDMLIKLLTSMLRISNDKSSRRVKFEEDEDEESSPMEMNKIKINGIIINDSLNKIWERSLELSLRRENQTSWLNCLRQLQELCITVNQESTGCFIAHKYLDQLKELLNGQSDFTSVSTRNINYKHTISMLLNCCDSLSRNKSEIIFYLSSHDDSYVRSNFYEILPKELRKIYYATKYALERKAFGQPIANHQAIQFKLADMIIGIETAQLAYLKAAWMHDNGIKNTLMASIAECYAASIANRSATEAVQTFGGAGFNCDYPVEKLYRDAKILQIYEGTEEIQKIVIAREHIKRMVNLVG